MNYHLTLKCHFESLTKGQRHDVIGKGHDAYQSIRIVDLSTSIVLSSTSHRSSLSLSKVIGEKLLVIFMTGKAEMTSAT